MNCEQCSTEYKIAEQEIELREKLAPEIGGKKFDLPESNLCPICRNQKMAAFRNERKLYKRKCNHCDKEIISVYSPDKKVNALCRDCFWSDKVDGTQFNLDYNPEQTFFSQFGELLTKGKLLALFAMNNENSEYVNQEKDIKDSYMCVGGHWNQECYHCTFSLRGDNNTDCYFIWDSNNLYESIGSSSCSNSQYLSRCSNCSDSYLCEDCIGCSDCFGSCNLHRKQYYFFNEPLSKQEYSTKLSAVLSSNDSRKKAQDQFDKHRLNYPKKFAVNRNSEECAGDNLANCKKMDNSFWSNDSEDCSNGYITGLIKDSLDSFSFGIAELCYELASSSQVNRSYCSSHISECDDAFYSSNCFNCKNIFGCVGLVKKEYCILNKQYTKEGYFEKVNEIISNMHKSGEWGSFFPMKVAMFGYNETVAQEIYPLTKEEALKLGANWQDTDFGIQFDGPFYEPNEISQYDPEKNPNAQKEIDECLKGILKCEISGKPFRIVPQELRYYIKHNIEIPTRHPDQRHLDRLSKVNPMQLWHRKCMNGACENEFETTYAPDRPEKVYCEECYQKAVI